MTVYEFDPDPESGTWVVGKVRSLREWNVLVKKYANPHTILALEGKKKMWRVAYQYTKNHNGVISYHTIERRFSMAYCLR
jgi:hypothetical protein